MFGVSNRQSNENIRQQIKLLCNACDETWCWLKVHVLFHHLNVDYSEISFIEFSDPQTGNIVSMVMKAIEYIKDSFH